jgi:hypothetical protein
MARRLQLEQSKAATIRWYPTEGVPTSATIQVVSPAGTDIVADGTSATIDSVAATVAAASYQDPTFSVDTATGISVGERYWLATAGGRGYEITVVDISGTTITPDQPVRFDISGGSLSGLAISYSLTTTHTATRYRDVRMVWRYTAGGLSRMHQHTADIVRVPFEIPVTESDIEQIDPTFGDLSSDYLRLREQAESDIYSWLRGRKIYPDLVIDRSLLTPSAVYRILHLRHIREESLREGYAELYTEALVAFHNSESWYDSDDDLTRSTDTEAGALAEQLPPPYMGVG